MRLLLILLSLIGMASSFGQVSIRSEINQIVDSIAVFNKYNSSRVGYGGTRTPQWESFLILKEKATNEELRQLTSHKNPAVRCYSFQALAERQDTTTFSILLDHLEDNEVVSFNHGCIGTQTSVGNFFVDLVTLGDISPSAYSLSIQEQQELDSLLIFDPKINLPAKFQLLKILKPEEQFYQRIRQLAEEKYPTAIISLARFQNEKDIEIIKAFFQNERTEYYAIYAAMEFPHSDFYPELVRVFKRSWRKDTYNYEKWYILYQALARYDNAQTLKFFNRTINTNDEFKRDKLSKYLLIAITKYPSDNYEAIRQRINLK